MVYVRKNNLHEYGNSFYNPPDKKGEKMKIKFLLSVLFGLFMFGGAFAADVTIYYSPTCPHCHHARDFVSNNLVYEYPSVRVNMVNVMAESNRSEFIDALKKCKYESGGVPVLVIGEKCFQGYGDSMRDDLRRAVEVGLSQEEVKASAEYRTKLEGAGADAFRAANAERQNAISERGPEIQKKSKSMGNVSLYVLLGALVVLLGIVLFRKNSK